MPDHRKLRVGDRIRLLTVPKADLDQRERELREGAEMAGWTADTLERIISIDPIVEISEVDEFGSPWFEYRLPNDAGEIEEHAIAIMEDESWEYVD
jgi:hypothetical protein